MVGELIKLRDRIDDLAVRKAVFQAEEQALAGEYDAAIAQVEVVEKLLAGHPEALEELKRVRTQLQEFRGLARDDRMVARRIARARRSSRRGRWTGRSRSRRRGRGPRRSCCPSCSSTCG
jgi:hypothetical protein